MLQFSKAKFCLSLFLVYPLEPILKVGDIRKWLTLLILLFLQKSINFLQLNLITLEFITIFHLIFFLASFLF